MYLFYEHYLLLQFLSFLQLLLEARIELIKFHSKFWTIQATVFATKFTNLLLRNINQYIETTLKSFI